MRIFFKFGLKLCGRQGGGANQDFVPGAKEAKTTTDTK
jgi:hypothetical protein